MTYEYLLTGLEELRLGQSAKLSFEKLLELLKEQMSPADFRFVEQLQKSASDADMIELMQQDEVQDRFHETTLSEEDFRTQLLYEQGMKSRNAFLRAWYEFNLNLNNVLAAAVCKKYGYDIEQVIVGDNEVAQLLRKGGVQKNTNLAAVLPELADIIAISNIQNMLQREQHIDALRWQWLEDNTRFKYFTVDNVLAYFLQATILHRWDGLNREQGEQIFRNLLTDLKKDVHFD